MLINDRYRYQCIGNGMNEGSIDSDDAPIVPWYVGCIIELVKWLLPLMKRVLEEMAENKKSTPLSPIA